MKTMRTIEVGSDHYVRVFFNRHHDPNPWSIDQGPGTEEIQVERVTLIKVDAALIYRPGEGDNDQSPTAWIHLVTPCVICIAGGVASIHKRKIKGLESCP